MKWIPSAILLLTSCACTPSGGVTPPNDSTPAAMPASSATLAATESEPPPTVASPAASADPTHSPVEPEEAAPVASSAAAPPPEPPPPQEPKLLADDGTVLPQTEDKPTTESPLYQHHAELLFRAIVEDDPEIARPFFFPRIAYEQVKAIAKPGWDWDNRLWKHFVRDVHAYHKQLGDNPQAAKLERVVLREPSIRWMKPHTEGNRLGYFRVTRSHIRGSKADGTPIDLELTSMISWRGAWYVVHLHGFQ